MNGGEKRQSKYREGVTSTGGMIRQQSGLPYRSQPKIDSGLNSGREFNKSMCNVFIGVGSNGCSSVRWRDFERPMGMNTGSDGRSGAVEGMGKDAISKSSSGIS